MISKSFARDNRFTCLHQESSLILAEIMRIQRLEGGEGLDSAAAEADSPPPAEATTLSGLKYVDVYRERPIRLTVRVLVPVNEHPKVRENEIYYKVSWEARNRQYPFPMMSNKVQISPRFDGSRWPESIQLHTNN